jgi:hypothetical protein
MITLMKLTLASLRTELIKKTIYTLEKRMEIISI